MHYDWILDVLTDLKSFAVTNGLTVLAEQLDDASLIAAMEIGQSKGVTSGECAAHADMVAAFYRVPSASKNA